MGLHAFRDGLEHCEVYRELVPGPLPALAGLDESWNMPAARHRASLTGEAYFRGVDHYVLSYQFSGAEVRRTDRVVFDQPARKGALSLQAPGSGASFRSDGLVEYAHLYFRQSLLCEIGDSLQVGDLAEIDDFFARYHPATAAEVATYLRRAADSSDPPTAIEMDSRAYLIGLALLRSARDRALRLKRVSGEAGPYGLGRALELIEDQLAKPLRLSDLAAATGLSPFHFARLFKREMGSSPAQHLMRRRTERATELIRETQLPLIEVAYLTGFANQAHMTRRVKALTGQTPGTIRERG